ncbi:hypothetical protein L6452_34672 [Arctium lappa]|uniref:Uncharacterized protein n=1 Tax=Arctium lappa TaxID=4217 RepID=A0ACB8YIW8_ARCLA|nr:hypothetical protein L6452_34672 [Arctium lappa]
MAVGRGRDPVIELALEPPFTKVFGGTRNITSRIFALYDLIYYSIRSITRFTGLYYPKYRSSYIWLLEVVNKKNMMLCVYMQEVVFI